MSSVTLYTYLLAVTLLLASIVTAFPFERRNVQWSFELNTSPTCNGTTDAHLGSGSTGCRADLQSVASAYKLNFIVEGCRIEFFDNTMCNPNEISDVAGSMTATETCRVPGLKRGFGSYMVTCGSGELK